VATASGVPVQCANPECRVGESGKCVEGLATSECSHFGKPRLIAASAKNRIAGTPLPGADRLTQTQATKHMRAVDTKVVAIVAPTGSGKTSLIAAVYDLFQNGPAGTVSFARTSTFHAFEIACHDSRAASLRDEAEQQRTPRSGLAFYHLQLKLDGADRHLGLLLADRSGEDYRALADDPKLAADLVEVTRAEVLTLLVDGKRLLDNGERHNLRGELALIIKTLVDTSTVRHGQHLCVVLSKLDAVTRSEHRARAEGDFDRIVASLRTHHSDAFASITSFKVAASPKLTGVSRGEGVTELLRYWTSCSIPTEPAQRTQPAPKRAFGRLTSGAKP
jgi:hypothetical protein